MASLNHAGWTHLVDPDQVQVQVAPGTTAPDPPPQPPPTLHQTMEPAQLSSSPPQPPASASAPVPSRRQSCDRCHEQKVRCFTDDQHYGSSGCESGAQETLSSTGQSIPSVPCTRCKRARATCVYSPPQRSGRPRISRDPFSPPLRKRRRRTSSRCSSTSSTASAAMSQPSPPTSAGMMYSFAGNAVTGSMPGALNVHHQSFFAEQQAANSGMFSPAVTDLSRCFSQSSYDSLGLPETNVVIVDEWPISPLSLAVQKDMDATTGFNCHPSTSMPQITSFPPLAMPQPVSHLASGINQLYAADSNNLHGHVSAGEYMFDSPDHHVNNLPEELAETSLRIQRAVRSLPSFRGDVLSLSSPPVDELLETACCLVNLMDRYTMGRISMPTDTSTHHGGDNTMRQHPNPSVDNSPEMKYESPFLPPSSPSTHSHNHSAADTAMYLMMLSSHQTLLGAFEDIASTLLQCIRELSQPTGGSPATDFISSSTTQIVSHLLARLDAVVGALAGSADLLHAVGHIESPPVTATTATTTLLSPISSSSSSASSSTTSPDGFDNFYEAQRIHVPTASSYSHEHERADAGQHHHHRQLSAFLVFEQMEQRQFRVQEQVEMLKELIRWSSTI
ncbi:hypothetical protein B0T19DRAFT_35540 [Cercophora scortea]|uniref:Zn(2)-C6 fungal-type domain-containing protein n=1 Tax=Cercophora scortea TaxID=314031 RepID=A0AAE0MMB2_9PEZI|nr:hypothetical protein B0T19DRAFT_35540 [Cercophora scortea]